MTEEYKESGREEEIINVTLKSIKSSYADFVSSLNKDQLEDLRAIMNMCVGVGRGIVSAKQIQSKSSAPSTPQSADDWAYAQGGELGRPSQPTWI